MCPNSLAPRESSSPASPPTSPGSHGIRRPLRVALTLLTITEPLWAGAAVASVFVCHLLGLGSSYLWIGLGLVSLTVPLHIINRTTSTLPTRFDLPLALLMIGALIGLLTSPNSTISLGAFQCMLALSLLYYSWVNYSRLSGLMKCVLLLAPAAMIVSLLLAVFDLPSPSTQPNFDFGGVGTHHGLALALVIIIAVLAGIAVFGDQPRTRLIAAIACISFIIITFILTWDSLRSLLAWDSITGRLPIWGDTLDMLADAPLAGLGLGCWALTYHGTAVITSEITHAHNAYLELYSNTGIVGAIAFVFFLAIGLKVAWDLIKAPRESPWYGFGVGVVLACATTLLVGVVESAPAGVPLVASDTYYYLISPVPWILAGLLVIARKLQTGQPSL